MKNIYLALALVTAPLISLAADLPNKNIVTSEEVTPNEDLMREHGVLRSLLLVYQEIIRRIDNHEALPSQVVSESAKIARGFVEDYHEKLEEEFVFPQFEKAHVLTELVRTLKEQHDAGRVITDYVLAHAVVVNPKDEMSLMILADYLRLYIRMFAPHAVQEDTVLFPAFRKLLPNDEYMKLGDLFEDREQKLFGKQGFETMVEAISNIEKQLGIYTLSQFTFYSKKA